MGERDQDGVVGHRIGDLAVQADGRAAPGVGADLDLAEVDVLGVDDLGVAEAGARPGLDDGLLGGPAGGQGLGLAAGAGPGRAALTGGERLREPGAGLVELLGEGGDADDVDADADGVRQVARGLD